LGSKKNKIGVNPEKLGNISQEVRISKSALRTIIAKKFLAGLLIADVGIAIIYIGFAATLVRYTYTNNGFLFIQNNTYHGQILPHHAEALVTRGETFNASIISNLREAFIPQKNTEVVRVLAGPDGRIQWHKPVLKINGKIISKQAYTNPRSSYLSNEYVGECIKGNCVPGAAIYFDQNTIMGILVNSSPNAGKESH
jgi:hypothetical protein